MKKLVRHSKLSRIILLFFIISIVQSATNLGVSVKAQTSDTYIFIAYGDTRGSGSDAVSPLHANIVNAFLQHSPELIIHTGDMVNEGGVWNQWLNFNASIQPIWEAGIPLFGIVGNHEKYTDQWNVFDTNFTNYKNFFDFTHVIDQTGETELHYSFDYKGIHFIILNTEDYFDYDTNMYNCSASQMDWLLTDLAQTTQSDFIVASFHRPAWSIRQDRADRWAQAETVRHEFHQLFIQYDVDLVFNGHDHHYFRGIRDGIYYIVTGGGGASLYPPDPSAPHWQEGDIANQTYHYCRINVEPSTVSVSIYRLDNTTIDSFDILRSSLLIPLPIELLVPHIIGLYILVLIIVSIVVILKKKAIVNSLTKFQSCNR